MKNAKEIWRRGNCEEIERLREKYLAFNFHERMKPAAGLYIPKKPACSTGNEDRL